MEQVEPTRRFSLRTWIVARWRHRYVTDPATWELRVGFEQLMMAQSWDVPANFDELNDRYSGSGHWSGPHHPGA